MPASKHAADTLTFAHGLLDKMLATIPGDKTTYQIHPTSNHVLWTLGHLSTTYTWLASTINPGAAPKLPENYDALFGQKSAPNPETTKYPPFAELKKNYDASFNTFLKLVQGLSDTDAWSPCAIDTGGFSSSKIDSAYKCAWHDGWHLGQIADLRRALKLPSIF